tara:strand:+ start:264 stop:1067 length:804 start_codon:yes stop_codon:yes gene_type:complete
MQKKDIDKNDFNYIDKDKSGSIDITELNSFYGKNNYMEVADINNDNIIDYPEFERLANINKFGEENGGNLFVRNAINFGLLDKRSILADGKASVLVGNKGFDPLNCAVDISTLKKYREAEIKHGRLAMLASVGWPLSEIYHPYLSKFVNKMDMLSFNGKAPSILNGGLDKINPLFFITIIVFTATVESIKLNNNYNNYFDDKIPGDLGFDPLKLYVNKDPKTKSDLELKEINNGRLAMVAITYYALCEFINNIPIINNTPFLFKSFL